MLMYLSGVSIFLSIATKSMTHPVSFMAVILAQTLIICLISSLINSSSWFGFVLFLIFMGGVMVLFVYMSSLASNENFLWEPKDLLVPLAMILLLLILFTTWNPETPSWLNLKSLMTIFSIYSNKFCTFMIYIIMYLLITLLIVSSVIKKNKGPIRSIK